MLRMLRTELHLGAKSLEMEDRRWQMEVRRWGREEKGQ
jgi:hypothetical protein